MFGSLGDLFGTGCSGATAYFCWVNNVWNWIMVMIIPVSTLMLVIAGGIYMTSAGDTTRIKLAREMAIGVFSGLAILLFAAFILYQLIGVPSPIPGIGGSLPI